MLKFFGRGSAFTKSHNSAYFYADDALILIDCPMSSFHVLLEKGITQKQIYVLVTHTHGDHVGGIPMLIHCARYMADAHVTVIAPTAEVAEDLKYLIDRLEGCDPAAYTILTADQLDREWFIGTVPVHHAPSLEGRCFGFRLRISGTDVLYTGDTAELEPFLPYLHSGAYLYTEAACFDSGVHLYIDRVLPELKRLTEAGVHVCLMHLDDEAKMADNIRDTAISFAPLG